MLVAFIDEKSKVEGGLSLLQTVHRLHNEEIGLGGGLLTGDLELSNLDVFVKCKPVLKASECCTRHSERWAHNHNELGKLGCGLWFFSLALSLAACKLLWRFFRRWTWLLLSLFRWLHRGSLGLSSIKADLALKINGESLAFLFRELLSSQLIELLLIGEERAPILCKALGLAFQYEIVCR